MTTEEKAKAYDEAIEVAQRFYNNSVAITKKGLEDIFPELKESEDERIRKAIINVFATHKDYEIFFGASVKDILAWLEKQAQKTAWSEEDEKIIIQIKKALEDFFSTSETDKIKYWLNSLKDRVQPQLKQEWSEEDERIRIETIELLETANHPNVLHRNGKPLDFTENINWLKSLRPQNWTKEDKERYINCLQRLGTGNPEQPETINSKWFKEHVYPQNTWKPSDEQMNALWSATEKYLESGNENVRKLRGEVLESLYEDLKKLKGE